MTRCYKVGKGVSREHVWQQGIELNIRLEHEISIFIGQKQLNIISFKNIKFVLHQIKFYKTGKTILNIKSPTFRQTFVPYLNENV